MPRQHAHARLADASRRLEAAARSVLMGLAASAVLLVVLAGQGVLPAPAVVIGLAASATAATLLALTVAATRPAVGTVALRPARRGTPAERVEASTPFWCSVQVAHRPRRPRAPGGRGPDASHP